MNKFILLCTCESRNFYFRFPYTIFTRGTGGGEKTQKQINLLSWPRPLNHLGHGRTSYTNIAIWSPLGWQAVWGETIVENVTNMYLAFRMPSLSSTVSFMAYVVSYIGPRAYLINSKSKFQTNHQEPINGVVNSISEKM